MKGPSLERQYNIIQEQIKKKIDNYNSKKLDYNFPDLKEKLIESFQKFDVQECDYLYDPQFPVGMGVGPIRYSRWELYKFDEEKFQVCKNKTPKELNCRECQSCGLWDVDGHYKIPCYNIMKVGIDL
jgi:hypothetical protein